MASGKAHTRATLVATPFVFVALGPVAACGTLSGIPLTPDLDHHATTGVEKLPIVGSTNKHTKLTGATSWPSANLQVTKSRQTKHRIAAASQTASTDGEGGMQILR
ncbi:MAG: hypothetical protein H6637_05260 [Ardenticatenales bacterium]|nr:hypothetical protein [Ardenticatenales bacterium]